MPRWGLHSSPEAQVSRLSEAVDALRKAAGARPFVLVVDVCAPTASTFRLRIEGPSNAAPYTLIGLLRQAQLSVEECAMPSEAGDEPDDEPDPE